MPARPLRDVDPNCPSVVTLQSKYSSTGGMSVKSSVVHIRPISFQDVLTASDIEALLSSSPGDAADNIRTGIIQLYQYNPNSPSLYHPPCGSGPASASSGDDDFPTPHYVLQVQHRVLAVNRYGVSTGGYYHASAATGYSITPEISSAEAAAVPANNSSSNGGGASSSKSESGASTSRPASRSDASRPTSSVRSGSRAGSEDANAPVWSTIAVFVNESDMAPATKLGLLGDSVSTMTTSQIVPEALSGYDDDDEEQEQERVAEGAPQLHHEYASLFPSSIHHLSTTMAQQQEQEEKDDATELTEEQLWLLELEGNTELAPTFRAVSANGANVDREMMEALDKEEALRKLESIGGKGNVLQHL
jgi:hypothetical protein